jgi:hypothetical protein
VIPAAALLVVAAVAFAEAMHVPAFQLIVVVVGIPLFLVGFVWLLIRVSQPTRIDRPAPRTVRGQIVATRVAPPVHSTTALPYGATAVRALPAARLRLLEGGRTEETA